MRVTSRIALGLLVCLGATACGGAESEPQEQIVPDTGVIGGLSPEEIQRQVTPMSPEVAESLGIVDTTIRIEPQAAPDSGLPIRPAPGTPTGPDPQTNPLRPSNPARPDSAREP